jgi:hypothetical protein
MLGVDVDVVVEAVIVEVVVAVVVRMSRPSWNFGTAVLV